MSESTSHRRAISWLAKPCAAHSNALACTTLRCGNVVDAASFYNSARCVWVTGNAGELITGMHFTPTSSSWLILVGRWFGELTQKKIRRGTHTSVRALQTDIGDWTKTWNENPKPYVWTKTADEILAKLAAFCARTSDSEH